MAASGSASAGSELAGGPWTSGVGEAGEGTASEAASSVSLRLRLRSTEDAASLGGGLASGVESGGGIGLG